MFSYQQQPGSVAPPMAATQSMPAQDFNVQHNSGFPNFSAATTPRSSATLNGVQHQNNMAQRMTGSSYPVSQSTTASSPFAMADGGESIYQPQHQDSSGMPEQHASSQSNRQGGLRVDTQMMNGAARSHSQPGLQTSATMNRNFSFNPPTLSGPSHMPNVASHMEVPQLEEDLSSHVNRSSVPQPVTSEVRRSFHASLYAYLYQTGFTNAARAFFEQAPDTPVHPTSPPPGSASFNMKTFSAAANAGNEGQEQDLNSPKSPNSANGKDDTMGRQRSGDGRNNTANPDNNSSSASSIGSTSSIAFKTDTIRSDTTPPAAFSPPLTGDAQSSGETQAKQKTSDQSAKPLPHPLLTPACDIWQWWLVMTDIRLAQQNTEAARASQGARNFLASKTMPGQNRVIVDYRAASFWLTETLHSSRLCL